MDLIRKTKPDSQMAKWPKGKPKLHTVTGGKAIEADRLFNTFLGELELAGYSVKREFATTTDMTAKFAEVRLGLGWGVGMGARLTEFVVWASFLTHPYNSQRGVFGEYEETFKDADDAIDWVMDYIRSVEAL